MKSPNFRLYLNLRTRGGIRTHEAFAINYKSTPVDQLGYSSLYILLLKIQFEKERSKNSYHQVMTPNYLSKGITGAGLEPTYDAGNEPTELPLLYPVTIINLVINTKYYL